ncbi:hypothetical protein RhiirA5_447592 [Rhizophagus irregularis]|uniref:Uncharacterized protein n=1 Tax=Rhizophagus irregularis TaxID=588596 RepID=A0A2N0NB34_9GLOM|nr:hypothetical protein RhiirA5_447592 [Rhizophagus irregularis]
MGVKFYSKKLNIFNNKGFVSYLIILCFKFIDLGAKQRAVTNIFLRKLQLKNHNII